MLRYLFCQRIREIESLLVSISISDMKCLCFSIKFVDEFKRKEVNIIILTSFEPPCQGCHLCGLQEGDQNLFLFFRTLTCKLVDMNFPT